MPSNNDETIRLSVYKKALECIDEIIFIIDNNYSIIMANTAFLKIFNKKIDEIIGNQIKEIFDKGEFYDILKLQLDRSFNNRIVKYEAVFEKQNAQKNYFEISSYPLTENGEVVCIITKIKDVTTRKILENRLKESEHLFRKIFEASPIGIEIYDPYGQLVHINKAYLELFGIINAEKIKGFQLFDDPNLPYDIKGQIWAGKSIKFDAEFDFEKIKEQKIYETTKSGKMFVERVVTPIQLHTSDEQYGYLIHMQDVTQQKIAETELKKAKEIADEANKIKSQFLANMSHEIRTPLNAIIGFANLALKNEFTHEQFDCLSKIRWASNSLLQLINSIMDFAKIEAGKMEVMERNFQIQEVTEGLEYFFIDQLEEKKIEFIISIDKNVPTDFIGDLLKIRQILINLTNNAVKFTESGEIIIQISCIEKTEESANLQFKVKDSGIGISKEHIEKIFLAFNQVYSSTTRRYSGTGLGLTICKELVNLMGGEIWVESVPGQGSTFCFTLSLKKQKIKPKELLKANAHILGLKILVVDDSKFCQLLFIEMLNNFGFKAESVGSGTEALEILRKNALTDPFHLVLMDWDMPEMDGFSASKKIRECLELRDILIIIVSGFIYEKRNMLKQLTGNVIDAFLPKPLRSIELFDTIIKITDKKNNVETPGQAKKVYSPLLSTPNIDNVKVLLVEDDYINQQVMQKIIESSGISVDIVDNGKIAVDALENNNYDIVIMDLQMPVLDGYSATTMIRKNNRFKNLPIIGMTAHIMQEEREECLKAGMNDLLYKPVDIERLFSTLKKWIPVRDENNEKNLTNRETAAFSDNLLKGLPELDVKEVLYRLKDDVVLFKKILRDFVKNFAGITDDINNAIIDGNIKRARNLIHSLNGVSSNISAKKLSFLSEELENDLRGDFADEEIKSGNIDIKLKKIKTELSRLSGSIKKIITHFDNIETKDELIKDEIIKIDKSELKLKLSKLYNLLFEKRTESLVYFESISAYLFKIVENNEISQLEKQINVYNFKGAIEALEKIKRSIDARY